MARPGQFLTIARLTALETVRRPVCLLLAVSAVCLTAMAPMLAMHSFGENGRLARDSGLACHLVFGLMIAAFAASSAISGEMRSGTAAAMLAKPVSRGLFFLAKYAGVTAVLLLFSTCIATATLLSERVAERFVTSPHGAQYIAGYVTDWQTARMLSAAPVLAFLAAGFMNSRTGRPFGSAAFFLMSLFLLAALCVSAFFDRSGNVADFDFRVAWRILPASLLVTFALCVVAALAMALSTRLNSTLTFVICSSALIAGMMSDFLVGRIAPNQTVLRFLCGILPNWQNFWVCDALADNGKIPAAYVARAALYAAAFSGAFLCLGLVSFRRTEVK